MLLKQYKIKIEFTLDIVGIDETTARENAKKFSNYEEIINDPEADQHRERQKRLLRALLDNKQVLDEYVRHRAASLIEAEGARVAADEIGDSSLNEEELLHPVIHSLESDDARFFQQVIRDGIYIENTDDFSESFKLKLIKAEINP